jgi:5'(3')-deoxyribonucleotidase
MLYLDLDGVFADFDGQLVKYGVIKNDQTFHHTHPSTWTSSQTELSRRVEQCMGTPGFWEEIPLMDGAYELWDYCLQYHPVILTAIPSKPEWADCIIYEKNKWIDTYLGYNADRRICLRSEKKDFVKNGIKDILLDDTIQNVTEWCEAGGLGLLHTDVENSIRKLDYIYKELH